MAFFQIIWTGGKKEIVKGLEFKRAFNEAGYGDAALKRVQSREEVSASLEETITYFEATNRSNGVSLNWEKVSPAGQARWTEQATEHKFRNFNTRPDKFPRIR